MNRVLKGFLLAPLAGAVVGSFASSLVFSFADLGGFGYGFLLVLAGAFYSYPVVLIVGVPFFFAMRRLGVLSLRAFLIVGVAFGALGWFVASSPIPSPEFYLRALSEGVFGLVSGLAGAAIFWGIAVHEKTPQPFSRLGDDCSWHKPANPAQPD